jgi:hypothetical protein
MTEQEARATERHRAVIAAAFRRWSEGDSAPLFELIDENVSWTLAGSCPGGGTFQGKQQFLSRSARPLHGRLSRSPVPIVNRVIADGDIVAVQWHGSGETHSGKPYNNQYCWVLRFAGERIVEITSYLDTLAVARIFEEGDS